MVAHIALRLSEELAGRGLRGLARSANVEHTTIGDLLVGAVWPDLVTVARLEAALGTQLWSRWGGQVRR